MAFCSKCGTQINDGAKFCPKCGQPTNEVSNVQNQSAGYNDDSEPEEEQIKTWQKIVSVLFWPAGAILLVVALIKKQSELAKSALIYTAIGIGLSIGLNIALGGCSNEYSEETESVGSFNSSSDDSSYDLDDVAKSGYENGYEFGFSMADVDLEPDAKQSFSAYYGAPQTAEEKKVYDVYKQNYDRGYREGVRAGRQ